MGPLPQVLEGLYTTSKEILNKWNDEGKPLLAKMQNTETGTAPTHCYCAFRRVKGKGWPI